MDGSVLPAWFREWLGIRDVPAEEERLMVRGVPMVMRGGILRTESVTSESQKQTEEAFGFKWQQRETFEREEVLVNVRRWLNERYGHVVESRWLEGYDGLPLVLDAGCGAAMSGLEYFAPVLSACRYVGVDISAAIDVAAQRFAKRGYRPGLLQADLTRLPIAPESVDVIFAEGVLHHTDSTETAFLYLATLLKQGGRFLSYVYKKKGPVREFTDDYIRHRLQAMSPEQAWTTMIPLTKLGKVLGDVNLNITVPESIELLGIPAGPIPLQRLLYWHVCKAFYRPDMTLDEMNHINFDWFAPRNAHRHTLDEVRSWCTQTNLTIERERVEEAGITIVARKV